VLFSATSHAHILCSQVSKVLQRDLLKGLEDAAREQSRSTVTAVVNAVSPVVAQAVAGALQRELAGSAAGGQHSAILWTLLALVQYCWNMVVCYAASSSQAVLQFFSQLR
jgi:hypothetical protein